MNNFIWQLICSSSHPKVVTKRKKRIGYWSNPKMVTEEKKSVIAAIQKWLQKVKKNVRLQQSKSGYKK